MNRRAFLRFGTFGSLLLANSRLIPHAVAAPPRIPNDDALRIAAMCDHIRRCAMADGALNLVPYRADDDPVLIDPYFGAYGLLALFAENERSQESSPATKANLMVIERWLMLGGELMAPDRPLPRNLPYCVDLQSAVMRDESGAFAGEPLPKDDVRVYYSLGRVEGHYDRLQNVMKLDRRKLILSDAHDSAAAMYLLVAGLYAKALKQKMINPKIKKGAIAAMVILKACAEKEDVFRSFVSPGNPLKQCMDNFEVHFGLTGAVWFFESFPKEAQCVRLASKAGQMAADLSKRLNVFELQLGGGSPYFGPLPNDTAALGVQGSHGYTNLMAVARLDPLPFRDKLFQLVETNPKIPQEFGNPPDEQRTLPENTYLPFWCLAVNRASLKESRQKYHEMLRSRVSYLVTQYKVMKQADVRIDNETRFIGRYAFRIQEYGLAVLAILSEFGPVKQLPDIPYLAKPEQR